MELSQIQTIRKKLGLTQTQFARQAGVSQSLIAKIESGRIDPKYSTVRMLERAIDDLTHHHTPTIASIMQNPIISCSPDETIPSIVKRMKKYGISQLPVMQDNIPVGTISEETILHAISKDQNITKLTASSIMEGSPPILSEDTPLHVAKHLLEYCQIIVVKRKEKPVGVTTKVDLINASL